MNVFLTPKSSNKKTGKIAVSTTGANTCPNNCPLKNNGCYADGYPLKGRWDEVTDGRRGTSWDKFCHQVSALPDNSLFRHNQAGDLPGEGNRINGKQLDKLAKSAAHVRGFTYTHKPDTPANIFKIKRANASGFTINLSANNLNHADELSRHGLPVVVVLPVDTDSKTVVTPNGRKVTVCPATYRDDKTCANCGLCAIAVSSRAIVGFPAHGNSKRKASTIAEKV